MSIPNVTANNIKDTPMLTIIVPTFPNNLNSGTAATVPKAPPPILFSPSAYASFTTSDIFCSILISPLHISYTLCHFLYAQVVTPSLLFLLSLFCDTYSITDLCLFCEQIRY